MVCLDRVSLVSDGVDFEPIFQAESATRSMESTRNGDKRGRNRPKETVKGIPDIDRDDSRPPTQTTSGIQLKTWPTGISFLTHRNFGRTGVVDITSDHVIQTLARIISEKIQIERIAPVDNVVKSDSNVESTSEDELRRWENLDLY